MDYYRETQILVYPYNPYSPTDKPIKITTTIIFEHEEEQAKAKAFLKGVYGWTEGVHYAAVEVKTIKECGTKKGVPVTTDVTFPDIYSEVNSSPEYAGKILDKIEMAKQTKPQETGLSVFEEQAKSVNLPDIPKTMVIGGLDFSEELIQKEVDNIKKVVLKSQDDKATYDALKAKKQQFVKTRTAPENFRKDVVKPLADWQKKLKSQTDAYGELAKQGEDHCSAQMKIYEDWEEEQERLKQEATQALVKARTADLQSVEGIINPGSLHWTFKHLPSKLVENSDLEDMDDSEWNGLMAELEKSYNDAQEALRLEREAFEASKNSVFNTRMQMLQLVGGYQQQEGGSFLKNGHTLTEQQIRETLDADWMPLVMSHNEPKASPFAQQPTTKAEDKPAFGGFGNASGPFGGGSFGSAPAAQEEAPQQAEPSEPLFYESAIGKGSTARLYRTENIEEATAGLTAKLHTSFENGFSVIVY